MTGPELHRRAVTGVGPCAFLLHGMLSSSLQWQPNLPRLAQHVRPVLFDLWGHGQSPAPTDEAFYTVDALVAQLEHAREELGESSLVLIGQSFGAGLVLQYALRHPHRVQALVFTNAVSAFASQDNEAMRTSRQRMIDSIASTGTEAIHALPMHPRRGKRLPASLKDSLVAAADAVALPAVVRLIRTTAPHLSVLDHLHRLQCPVLLVNGRYEAAFQPCRDLAAHAIPRCEVVDLDAGHAVNLEAIDGFDAAVAAFVDRLPDARPMKACG